MRKLQQLKYGWLIPVAILFVLSFPPLFGNEIVMILIGLVWGLGVGFAIVRPMFDVLLQRRVLMTRQQSGPS